MRQRLLPQTIANRPKRRWFQAFCGSLIVAAAGCTIDPSGTYSSDPAAPSTSTTTSGTGSSSSGAGVGGAGMGGAGTGGAETGGAGTGGAGGTGGELPKNLPKTCMEVLKTNPNAPSGQYEVDPDGAMGNPSFSVSCKMLGNNAWTLVGLENPQSTENLKFLGVETGTPEDLLAQNNALIGVRFKKLYSAVRIEWDNDRNLEFKIASNTEIFDDTVDLALPITSFTSSEGSLTGWVSGDAKFCRAASKAENRLPGDTSWAIKPTPDMNNACGCNSMSWAGQGAFYGGTAMGCNACSCYGGGFAGAKNNGEPKGITVNWQTRIYVL